MYSISLAEIEILNKLKIVVLDNKSSLDTIIGECNRISPLIDEIDFPYFYAATLLAAEGSVMSAIHLYRYCPDNAFARVVTNYLKEYGELTPRVQVFKDNSPYSTWIKTNFAKKYIKNSVNAIADFYSNNFPLEGNEITILDIGTGNGVMITEIVNKIIENSAVRNVNLILLDQSQDMLRTADEYCKKAVNAELTNTNICCKINEIEDEQLSIIKAKGPVSFINCALSIHHFPAEVKSRVLKLFKSLSPYCLISEVNWNHDIPDKYSPELIYAISHNMHYMLSDIIGSDITENEKKIAIEQFFLAETINIIKQPRESRIDYHTKIREWIKLANAAEYRVDGITPTVKNSRIAAFTMMLEKEEQASNKHQFP
ncbi:GRAS family protein [Sedimenticola sp.]|uniref:GRAS family protein n=1 Tax=Sedimenticola sp. TaxID=1940285 RepID=UPI003D0EA595